MRVKITITDQPRLRNGFTSIVVAVPEVGSSEVLDLDFVALHEAFGAPDTLALDLLLIAGIVYLLDKGIPRRLAMDAWTRQFSVSFPVSSPHRWRRSRAALEEALRFLTGDEWTVAFTGRPDELFVPPRIRRHPRRAIPVDVVTLFSGGLDSLAGTIDALAEEGRRAMLVGHHDATAPGGDQNRVYHALDAIPAYKGRSDLRRIRLRPLPRSLDMTGTLVRSLAPEQTQRSRSLVFLALGLYAARALGKDVPLLVPENGFIAVNMPLTSSRIGTCSTRTTHPYFLDRFAEAVSTVGLLNRVANPYLLKTKGEVLRDCSDQAALLLLAPKTVSCAHATRRAHWVRRGARNCGYCFPCLIRRSAMHVIQHDDWAEYGIDISHGELDLDGPTGTDLRALLDCVDTVPRQRVVGMRLLETGGLDADERRALTALVWRGMEELRAFIRDKGSDEMRQRAGIR